MTNFELRPFSIGEIRSWQERTAALALGLSVATLARKLCQPGTGATSFDLKLTTSSSLDLLSMQSLAQAVRPAAGFPLSCYRFCRMVLRD